MIYYSVFIRVEKKRSSVIGSIESIPQDYEINVIILRGRRRHAEL